MADYNYRIYKTVLIRHFSKFYKRWEYKVYGSDFYDI